MPWVALCRLDELTDGKGKYVEVDGFHLAVFLSNDRVSVIDSTCPHAGANLADGFVEDGCAVCPWHFWAFQLEDGKMRNSTGVKMIQTYSTRLFTHGDRQFVQADLPTY